MVRDATTAIGDAAAAPSARLPGAMLILGDSLGYTLALLVTFLGIGIVVNVLIVYIVAQVLAERKQNREFDQRY
jgi:hypothetical protein